MARRASGEGNIRKNVLGKTQAEVKDKLRNAIETSSGLDVAKADSYTVENWLNTWFELYAKPNIRETTQRSYRGIIDLHIVPYIGKIMLTKLTTRDIQKMYNDLRHTFATTALQNGVDIRTVSGMLGHFDAGFTLRTYTHVTNQVQEQAANTIGNVMSQHI